ncbi:MAG: glycosyltransferase [Sediminibacterium sp.]|nr:MAG: glycosyltransferase [Sediminibacterium sp.]
MNIAGVVILYHPDIQLLSDNIKTYVQGLKQLYVYDNSETKTPGIEEALSKLHPSIQYYYFNANEGIAKRLNRAVEEATRNNYDYLLTMDQDSAFKAGDFEKYKLQIQLAAYNNVVQFGVNCQPHFTIAKDKPEEVLTLITSGSILNLSLKKNIGTFNEDLFIDFVDAEFSYQVIQRGYINLMFSNIVLNHALGKLIEGRSLANFKKTMRITHSPIRIYYIIRNGLYLLLKAKGLTGAMKKDVLRCIKIIKNDLIYNPELSSVYINLFSGIFAFLTSKMGKK